MEFLPYLLFVTLSNVISVLNLKKECIVSPPAFKAATPVGANITNFFLNCETRYFKKVVFPVPAFPVTKTLSFVCNNIFKAS